MRTVSRTIDPEPPRLGVLEGLAYALFEPSGFHAGMLPGTPTGSPQAAMTDAM